MQASDTSPLFSWHQIALLSCDDFLEVICSLLARLECLVCGKIGDAILVKWSYIGIFYSMTLMPLGAHLKGWNSKCRRYGNFLQHMCSWGIAYFNYGEVTWVMIVETGKGMTDYGISFFILLPFLATFIGDYYGCLLILFGWGTKRQQELYIRKFVKWFWHVESRNLFGQRSYWYG